MTDFIADLCDNHPEKVSVLGPGYSHFGGIQKCEGEVVTVKLDRNNSELIKLLRDEDGGGKIVVVDSDREYYAIVGEMLMQFAEKNNYAGIILNGYVRDTDQIKETPVVLYALGTCPKKSIPVTEGERGTDLSFGGVEIKNGDYLYADRDGVVVTAQKI